MVEIIISNFCIFGVESICTQIQAQIFLMLIYSKQSIIFMSDSQKNKAVLKKSSIQLQETSSMKQQSQNQSQQVKESFHMGQKQPQKNHQNLLDLSGDWNEKKKQEKKQYEQFLENRVLAIQGPELVTQNVIKSYKLYKIKTRKKEQQQFQTCVSRRFSDFEYLQKQLIQNHGGCIIPLLPEKNIWANVNMQGNQQITSRVKGLQKYLKSLLNHKVLRTSQQLKTFLFEAQIKFSQKKGQYFSKVKTQQKLKQIASNAYALGKGLITRYITGPDIKEESCNTVIKPSVQDIRLMQYQRQVTDLVKVINVLRKVCQNSVLEMKTIGQILPDSKQSQFQCNEILNQFQDLCKYILSCNQSLSRRHQIRLEIDQLNLQYESLQKKIKTNPRSQEVDLLRNKISKATQKCQKWTASLLQQLQDSISVGKSMIEDFINNYTEKKQKFYDL